MDSPRHSTIFLLSPADVNGIRARHITRKGAGSELALRYRSGTLCVEDAFAYMSALYFRGKLAYARAFGRSRDGEPTAFVIVPGFGLVPFGWILDEERVRKIRRTDVDPSRRSYSRPLRDSLLLLRDRLGPGDQVVLLGSVATGKYVDVIWPLLGDALRFPGVFAGTGDMRRGALMLRAARDGEELEYVTLDHTRSYARGRKAAAAPQITS